MPTNQAAQLYAPLDAGAPPRGIKRGDSDIRPPHDSAGTRSPSLLKLPTAAAHGAQHNACIASTMHLPHCHRGLVHTELQELLRARAMR